MNFTEILKKFNSKHKLIVVLIFLLYGTVMGLGEKYLDSKNRVQETERIDSITTQIEKNCELQKRELLITQSVMQGQINDILKDLVTLRTQMAHGYLDTYKPESISKPQVSSDYYAIMDDTIINNTTMMMSRNPIKSSELIVKKKTITKPVTKSSSIYKCIQQIDKIIDKAENIK